MGYGRPTFIALTTEFGGPMNFRLIQLRAISQQNTEPSLLPVNTNTQTSAIYHDVCHLFENVELEAHNVIDFIKETGFYKQL